MTNKKSKLTLLQKFNLFSKAAVECINDYHNLIMAKASDVWIAAMCIVYTILRPSEICFWMISIVVAFSVAFHIIIAVEKYKQLLNDKFIKEDNKNSKEDNNCKANISSENNINVKDN